LAFKRSKETYLFVRRDVSSTDLPLDCYEYARTPRDLFKKLDEWDADSIVIPHGQSWGFHVPLGTSWDNRLNNEAMILINKSF
jgi:hypothetical protein